MKLYYIFIGWVKKVNYVIENTLNLYKVNKLPLVTSCFSLWELISNWFIWKFGKKGRFICVVSMYFWGKSNILQITYHFILL